MDKTGIMSSVRSDMPQAGQCYVLWGSAGHAKVLASLITLTGGKVIALFDRDNVTPAIEGVPLYVGEAGFKRWVESMKTVTDVVGLAAIGGARGRDRLAIHALFRQQGLLDINLIHPNASVCISATIGAGTQILAQAVVSAEARIGEACILNHRASIDHECLIGNGVHIAPGATLCGCINIGDNVMIGAGAVVLPRLSIGDNSVIGAGAVITKNVPAGVTVIGNPGRVIKQN
ncbi:MAG: NeuD/PglB/VioB family sugar acetyltransferase [Undibacterium sp.]|nr:NeuD/PglB/VioB family sugar acetyltransferase [Undibacterium sp.]